VLSFDGTMLGISSGSADAGNQSVVYSVPATGGTPTRITKNAPSYFHSWSTDAKTLFFTGLRDGELDVYKISADGGDEVRLTNARAWTTDQSRRRTAVDLLQLLSDRADADLEDAPGRDRTADHRRRVQQLVSAYAPDGKSMIIVSFLSDVDQRTIRSTGGSTSARWISRARARGAGVNLRRAGAMNVRRGRPTASRSRSSATALPAPH
jgi:hypothetical protein